MSNKLTVEFNINAEPIKAKIAEIKQGITELKEMLNNIGDYATINDKPIDKKENPGC